MWGATGDQIEGFFVGTKDDLEWYRDRGGVYQESEMLCTTPRLDRQGVALVRFIPADCFGKFLNSFTINDLLIHRRCSSPHYVHRDETDFPRPYWPLTEVRRLRNASRPRRTG